ncbi:MAG TPA: recombinase RecT [Gemmatimonadaceae bacterium]|jgi:recombination protein RecT
MSAPLRSTAVATVESSVERPAVPYVLRSRTAEILNTDEARAQIAPFIPRGVDFNQVMLEVHRCATNVPEILECTPPSIIQAVGQAVQTGLTIGKTIHLVPVSVSVGKGDDKRYEKRLQAWTDYKGDIELVLWSGAARHIDAHAVYQHDVFDYDLGDNPFVKHKPVLDSSKRGPIIGGYCIAFLNASGTLKKITVLSIADVEKVRAKSKQWNPDKVKVCPDWYVEKTCVHRNCKTLPKNPRLASVIAMMDAREAHDRGEDFTVELDPANRIEAQPSRAAESAVSPLVAHEDAAAHHSASVTVEEPKAPSRAAAFLLPFGKTLKGKPLGELTDQQLRDGYAWAKESGDDGLAQFIAMAEELMEERRLAKAGEEPL